MRKPKRNIEDFHETLLKDGLDRFRKAVEAGENERASFEAWGVMGTLFSAFGELFPESPSGARKSTDDWMKRPIVEKRP